MSDVQWNTIAPQLPKPAKTGRPRNNDRNTINGILFILTTGCRWADMPTQYGSKSTAHLRFSELQQKGIWKKILSKLIKSAHKQGKINLRNIVINDALLKQEGDVLFLQQSLKEVQSVIVDQVKLTSEFDK